MTRILLVANPESYHLGGHFLAAAKEVGLEMEVVDVRGASGPGLFQKLTRRFFDRRHQYMARFESELLERARRFSPAILLATGLAPIGRDCLKALGKLALIRTNYLTDDPFNPAHRSRWFTSALSEYDIIFSPRRANITDLLASGGKRVEYLPFGFNPSHHFPESGDLGHELESDILFVGGADTDRIPIITELTRSGLKLALYGRYWDRVSALRTADRGVEHDQATLRWATSAAKVTLVLVRRANRDGHVMRSFEAAASGGCLLVEDTAEHREIFGDSVAYFDSSETLIREARALVGDPERRESLKRSCRKRIVEEGANRYADRLRSLVRLAGRGEG